MAIQLRNLLTTLSVTHVQPHLLMLYTDSGAKITVSQRARTCSTKWEISEFLIGVSSQGDLQSRFFVLFVWAIKKFIYFVEIYGQERRTICSWAFCGQNWESANWTADYTSCLYFISRLLLFFFFPFKDMAVPSTLATYGQLPGTLILEPLWQN